METKVCKDCGEMKPLEELVHHPRRKGDRQNWCKSCRAVYLREWRSGRSRAAERRSVEGVAARFWPRVDKNGPEIIPASPCWLWTGLKDRKGYGRFYFRGHVTAAQRVACFLGCGEEIPRDLFACHRCDVSACVRPEHIFAGTCRDNLADMAAKGRSIKGRHHAPEKVQRGERHSQAKLTDADVLEIRRLHRGGSKNCDLARQFGITASGISFIVHGKSWRHLP